MFSNTIRLHEYDRAALKQLQVNDIGLRKLQWSYESASTIDEELTVDAADAVCPFTRWQHFAAWNNVMAVILKVVDVKSKIRLRQSMSI